MPNFTSKSLFRCVYTSPDCKEEWTDTDVHNFYDIVKFFGVSWTNKNNNQVDVLRYAIENDQYIVVHETYDVYEPTGDMEKHTVSEGFYKFVYEKDEDDGKGIPLKDYTWSNIFKHKFYSNFLMDEAEEEQPVKKNNIRQRFIIMRKEL